MGKIVDRWRSGRPVNLFFVMKNLSLMAMPRAWHRWRRRRLTRGWEQRPDADYIRSRVDLYCLPTEPFNLQADALEGREIRLGHFHLRSVFDLQRTLRGFSSRARVGYQNGDVWKNAAWPSLTKARRMESGAENAVLLKLDSTRMFYHPHDNIPTLEKIPQLLFRGEIHGKPRRVQFFEQWAGHPLFNLGDTTRKNPSEWQAPGMSVAEHFRYRYILALEGNDFSSCLQWVMASNCIPVMPRPTVDTWLMQSRMEPGVHYIEIAPDFSDAAERIEWYNAHPEEAERIARESKRWAAQFDDARRERLIQTLVVEKYLRLTGQPV